MNNKLIVGCITAAGLCLGLVWYALSPSPPSTPQATLTPPTVKARSTQTPVTAIEGGSDRTKYRQLLNKLRASNNWGAFITYAQEHPEQGGIWLAWNLIDSCFRANRAVRPAAIAQAAPNPTQDIAPDLLQAAKLRNQDIAPPGSPARVASQRIMQERCGSLTQDQRSEQNYNKLLEQMKTRQDALHLLEARLSDRNSTPSAQELAPMVDPQTREDYPAQIRHLALASTVRWQKRDMYFDGRLYTGADKAAISNMLWYASYAVDPIGTDRDLERYLVCAHHGLCIESPFEFAAIQRDVLDTMLPSQVPMRSVSDQAAQAYIKGQLERFTPNTATRN